MIKRLFFYLFCLSIAQNLSANSVTPNPEINTEPTSAIPHTQTQALSPEHTELSQSKAKWRSTGMVAYEYEYIRQCIDCGKASGYQVMKVAIDGDQVTVNNKPLTQASKDKGKSQTGWAMTDWFSLIEDYLSDQDKRFLQVEYNPLSGQPLKLKVLDGAGKTVIHLLKPAIPVKVDLSSHTDHYKLFYHSAV